MSSSSARSDATDGQVIDIDPFLKLVSLPTKSSSTRPSLHFQAPEGDEEYRFGSQTANAAFRVVTFPNRVSNRSALDKFGFNLDQVKSVGSQSGSENAFEAQSPVSDFGLIVNGLGMEDSVQRVVAMLGPVGLEGFYCWLATQRDRDLRWEFLRLVGEMDFPDAGASKLDVLRRALHSESAGDRAEAVSALGAAARSAEAQALLKARLAVEKNEVVRSLIESHLPSAETDGTASKRA